MSKSPERTEFLSGILTTAIESGPYGWFYVLDGEQREEDYFWTFAVIQENEEAADDEDNPQIFEVGLTTIAAGIGVLRTAVLKPVERGDEVLHNRQTGQRLFVSEKQRKSILDASNENEAADLDVVDALAILEIALFGQVKFN